MLGRSCRSMQTVNQLERTPAGAKCQAANAAEGPSTATGTIAPTVNGQAAEGTAHRMWARHAVTEGAAPGSGTHPTGGSSYPMHLHRHRKPTPRSTDPGLAQAAGAQLLRELQPQAQMNGAPTRHDLVFPNRQQATELPEEGASGITARHACTRISETGTARTARIRTHSG